MSAQPAKRVAILISGRGSNMAALIDAVAADSHFPARIVVVIANTPDAAGLMVARQAGIAAEIVPSRRTSRDAFEAELQERLDVHSADIVCLAGFMRLLTPAFVTRWLGRMVNIHPALLPAFRGLETHQRALEAGVKIHGATVHFVVPEVDAGPIIAQGAVPVLERDTVDSLAARVLAVEHRIYPMALKLLASGDVQIDGERVRIKGADTRETVLFSPALQGAEIGG